MNKVNEYKIGDEIPIGRGKLKCEASIALNDKLCEGCFFEFCDSDFCALIAETVTGSCSKDSRGDKIDVIFVKTN